MPWAAAAAVAGAALSSSATGKAASKASDATNRATDLQQYQYDTTRADQAPWRTAGENALSQMTGFQNPSLSANDVMNEPGYQFGLTQGLHGVQNTAAAQGGLYSGNALKALTQYGNDYASTKYGDAWNRMQNDATSRWNRLASLAGVGQTANNAVQASGANYANQAGNLLTSNASAQGAAAMNNANIWGNGLNSLVSAGNRRGWFSNSGATGSGQTWFNDPTDPSGMNATNGSDAGFMISDRRLKTNLRRLGTTPNGNTWYRWDWIDGSGSSQGVIAQEVQHIPGAVRARSDGVLTVNYAKV